MNLLFMGGQRVCTGDNLSFAEDSACSTFHNTWCAQEIGQLFIMGYGAAAIVGASVG